MKYLILALAMAVATPDANGHEPRAAEPPSALTVALLLRGQCLPDKERLATAKAIMYDPSGVFTRALLQRLVAMEGCGGPGLGLDGDQLVIFDGVSK